MKKWRKKLGIPLLSAGLVMSAFAPATAANNAESSKVDLPGVHIKHQGGPFDLGVVNEEKLLNALIRQGKIDKNQSRTEQLDDLQNYLTNRAKKTTDTVDPQTKKKAMDAVGIEDNTETSKSKKHKNANLNWNGNGLKMGYKNKLDSYDATNWNGKVREDKILVLLMEYPDKKHGTVNPEMTDMYYKNYPTEHYQDMIFGKNGYEGPNGENLVSMKQYYEKQSGESYTVSGNVAGWYMADHPAAYYGGNDPESGSDKKPRELIKEALANAAKDPNVDLSDYDLRDPMDLDGDNNLNEPDGIIDHLMVIHSGVGEEAGGGDLGPNAIWSHSWNVGSYWSIPGSETDVPYFGGQLKAFGYTVEPEDGAAGVFAHEYGHDLGLPDEYDTIYSGHGEPIAYWSIMSSGSWAGKIPGTEPTGFSPYAKEFLQNSMSELNWQHGIEVDLKDLESGSLITMLDAGALKGTNPDVVRVNLPDKKTVVNEPFEGDYEYYSHQGNNLDNSMVTTVDLTNSEAAKLTFKAWYDIETGWDYAFVQVKQDGEWVTVPGNITTTEDPNGNNLGNGITGNSNGWVDAVFDLSNYAGQEIQVRINYNTDAALVMPGIYVDNVQVVADGEAIFTDGAEDEQTPFELKGFTRDQGIKYTEHYYLLEWRNHSSVDQGLAHLNRGGSLMTYDPGLVIWYVDDKYSNNWVGQHPGYGFLGVVDAHQEAEYWSDGEIADTRYQVQDAAFSLTKTDKDFLDYSEYEDGLYMDIEKRKPVFKFNDSYDYMNSKIDDAGKVLPDYGLKVRVVAESKDKTVGAIRVSKQ